MYYLEDLKEGLEFDLGTVELSKEDIVDFAEKFDPQKFHTNEEVGKKMFGGIIASGWHTASLSQRLLVDSFLGQAACMASPGIDEMFFLKPVFTGDVLAGKLTIVGHRTSQSKPDRGLIKAKVEMINANNEIVLSYTGNIVIACRPST